MGEWRQIPEDKQLNPGDIVRLYFTAFGPFWMKAAEAAAIEASLVGKEGYELKSIDYNTPGKMIFEFRIIKTNPVIVTCLVIAGSVLLVGAALGLVFEKAEQFFETPAAVVGTTSFMIIALTYLYKSLRG